MPFLILVLLAVAVGVSAGLITRRYPRTPTPADAPAIDAALKVGETMRRHPGLRAGLDRRLNPEEATGLALTLALLFTVGAGIVLGLLAYLVRTNSDLNAVDRSVAKWGERHASPFSTHALDAVTQLGSIYPVVVALCIALAAIETLRRRSRWIVPFIVAVVGGEEILQTVIKQLVDRARPVFFNPAAATLGPSFPSGHSTTAAAFYAAAALLLGRRRPRVARAALTGAAVGIAVAVATSRVLLDDHWLTDVIGGLALGWAWFAICAVAFGGRLLHYGAAAKVAAQVAKAGGPPQRNAARIDPNSQPRRSHASTRPRRGT